jgi:REP element-mobilizing transposase RayT
MVYLHGVFSTKERIGYLKDADLRNSVWRFLAHTSTEMKCPVLEVGGTADHVHVLFRMYRDITQSHWIKEVKRTSSLWIKEQVSYVPDFHWQGGYALFSVSPSQLETVAKYIRNQEIHHAKRDFKVELRALLKKHGLEWDERYVWD